MTNKVFKICILGAAGVGKTSLTCRFVENTFDDKYQTTVGVSIKTKEIEIDGEKIKFILWDIEGENEVTPIQKQYMRNGHGCLLVSDLTREETLIIATSYIEALPENMQSNIILLMNKIDLADNSDNVESNDAMASLGHLKMFNTSAKTGKNVENAFHHLARQLLNE